MNTSEEICVICLDSILDSKTILEDCRHTFCNICIDKWTDIKMKCPICNKELQSLASKKKAPEAQHIQSIEEEFECLDHNYFVGELKVLKTKLDETKSMLKMNPKLSISVSAWTNIELAEVEINQKLKMMREYGKFCPKNYLHDIYRLDKTLGEIRTGKYREERKFSAKIENFPSYYQTEDDFLGDDEDDNFPNGEDSVAYAVYMDLALTKKKSKKNKKLNKKDVIVNKIKY